MVAARLGKAAPPAPAEKKQRPLEPGRLMPRAAARDRRTLELSQVFPVPESSRADYTLDGYFYIPTSFGVTPQTFDAADFYRNARVFLRLSAPDLCLVDLADLDHPHSPAAVLRRQIPLLLQDEPPSSDSLARLAQMYGAELADAVKRESKALLEVLSKKERRRSSELFFAVERFCKDARAAFHVIRRVRAKALAYQGVADDTLFSSLAFAEEFATSVLDEQIARLGRAVEDSKVLHDGTGTAVRARILLASLGEAVNVRRLAAGFAVPWGKSPEYFSYRISLLKKELQRALYIDTRAAGADSYITNSAAMIAAGLAATWAAIAQVPLVTGGQWSTTKGLLLVGMFVFAYMVKDRIKDWTKSRLTRRWRRWDHDRKIRSDALSDVGLGAIVGRAQEKASWTKSDAVPHTVRRLRRTRRTVRGTTPELEEILHWRRRITFEAENAGVPEGFALEEIFRLSLADFLTKLDDPKDSADFYDHTSGRFATREMPRLYHLNAIVVSTENLTGMSRATRWRLVVNRKGIKRIDRVAAA